MLNIMTTQENKTSYMFSPYLLMKFSSQNTSKQTHTHTHTKGDGEVAQ